MEGAGQQITVRPRVKMGRLLISAGRFMQSLAVAVMKPEDLVEFSRQAYSKSENIKGWASTAIIDEGLTPQETELLSNLPLRNGKLLLLGMGGGRDAVALARVGFEVTGVDFIPGMIEAAIENAAKNGIRLNGLVQEISQITVPERSFDIAWLTAAMYSCVPTRDRRIAMLRRIGNSLRSSGYFVCQFHWSRMRRRTVADALRKTFACLSLGNFRYEHGDLLHNNTEFMHSFSSERQLEAEFRDGGFELVHIKIFDNLARGGAILRVLD